MQRSVEKPSATSPDVPVEGDIRIRDARNSIGDYDRDIHEDHVWTEQAINTALNDSLSKHQHVPLLQIYDFNADQMRAQATRILQQAANENRELTDAEEREVIASQLRLTVLESIAGSLDGYMDLLKQFEKYKAEGMPVNPEKERIVFEHLELVKRTADERLRIAEELFVLPRNLTGVQKKNTDALRARLQKAAVEADSKMMRLLAAEDDDVPGANKNGILPVHSLILSMLAEDYQTTLKNYNDSLNQDARARTVAGNAALQKAFPGRKENTIPEDEADAVLSGVEPGYSLKKYHDDLIVMQNGQSKYEILKARGKVNVIQMADLNTAIGKYQLHRGELSSIRHHFDQAYDKSGKEKPFPGQTTDAAMNASRAYLDARQKGGIAALERHLTLVDTKVLKVGFKENIEKRWNENGRIYVSRIADQLATLETAWVPDIPFLQEKGVNANSSREYLMSGLHDALGWPRDEKGQPKAWADLTASEQKSIQDKQMSVEKAINTFRETGVLEKMQTSVSAAKAIINDPTMKAENFLQEGEIDRSTLPNIVVTEENYKQLAADPSIGPQKVYIMCFVQMEQNWSAYSAEYKTLLTDFHEAIGAHYDFTRMMKSFAKKQAGILALMAALGIGGWFLAGFAGAAAFAVLKYTTKKGAKLAWTTAKGGTKLVGKGVKAGVNVVKNIGKPAEIISKTKPVLDAAKPAADAAKVAPKVVKAAAETAEVTYHTYQEVSAAIKSARLAKNNEVLAKLLKHPLIAIAAKQGNAEAKGLLRVAKLLKAGKAALEVLPYLGVMVDIALLGLNEVEIQQAVDTDNLGLQQTLKTKRQVLGTGLLTTGGILLFASKKTAPAYLAGLVANELYATAVLDSAAKMDKTAGDWMSEEPEELMKELGKIPFNTITMGHRAGFGDSPAYRIWKNIAWKWKDIEEEDNKRMKQVEAVNQSMRQEILTAYFLKTMKVSVIEGESETAFKERVSVLLRDRMQYIRYLTQGTFDMSTFVKRFYDDADLYADMMDMRRQFEGKNRPILEYVGPDKKPRTLDLSPLDYVSQPRSEDEGDDDQRDTAIKKLFRQYKQEFIPFKENIERFKQEMLKDENE